MGKYTGIVVNAIKELREMNLMNDKRFTRYLLDGGFSFGDEYVPPRWSILDRKNNKSPFRFLEFEDEYKDICDEIVDELNFLTEENTRLKKILKRS